jgi:hypothetical protein
MISLAGGRLHRNWYWLGLKLGLGFGGRGARGRLRVRLSFGLAGLGAPWGAFALLAAGVLRLAALGACLPASFIKLLLRFIIILVKNGLVIRFSFYLLQNFNYCL